MHSRVCAWRNHDRICGLSIRYHSIISILQYIMFFETVFLRLQCTLTHLLLILELDLHWWRLTFIPTKDNFRKAACLCIWKGNGMFISVLRGQAMLHIQSCCLQVSVEWLIVGFCNLVMANSCGRLPMCRFCFKADA